MEQLDAANGDDGPPQDKSDLLPSLHRKLSKKIESGRGVLLSADELSLLVTAGALAALAKAATEYQVRKCLKRNARPPSTDAAPSGSIAERVGRTLRSSGTTSSDDANEALAQARAICRGQS